jgi:PEP-CTERM motif
MKKSILIIAFVALLCIARLGEAAPVFAAEPGMQELSDIINDTRPWLFVGTGATNDSTTPEGKSQKGVGDAVDISNFEIGAMKSPVPADNYGPNLAYGSNIPNVPGENTDAGYDGMVGALPLDQIITYGGNVAITHIDGDNASSGENGGFSVSNIGVFAKNESEGGKVPDGLPTGIVTAGDSGSIKNNSNSKFNDEDYPNSIGDPTSNSFSSDGYDLAIGNGITNEYDFGYLRTSLDQALEGDGGDFVGIPDLPGAAPEFAMLELNDDGDFLDILTGNVIDLSDPDYSGAITAGDVESPTSLYVKLNSGLNVIDINTGGNDLLLNNANIIIDGPEDAFAIFRVPTGRNFTISNGTILIGDSGILRGNVIFFSDTEENDSVFKFDNSIFNGIAFWTLGDGAGAEVNNSQGCVQFIGDKLKFSNIRYTHCFEGTVEPEPEPPEYVIPEPASLILFGAGLAGLFTGSYRRKKRSES